MGQRNTLSEPLLRGPRPRPIAGSLAGREIHHDRRALGVEILGSCTVVQEDLHGQVAVFGDLLAFSVGDHQQIESDLAAGRTEYLHTLDFDEALACLTAENRLLVVDEYPLASDEVGAVGAERADGSVDVVNE